MVVSTLRKTLLRLLDSMVLGMVLVTFLIVVLRYVFNLGWVWLQESVTYLHAAVFMLGAAWTWSQDGHVRVDVFYRQRSARHKAWINLFGCMVFLLPLCAFILYISWPYVTESWRLLERSREAGGLPLVFLLKSLIPALAILLAAQATTEIPRYWRSIRENPQTA